MNENSCKGVTKNLVNFARISFIITQAACSLVIKETPAEFFS